MTNSGRTRENLLIGIRVLDGGMASELEYLGADINGPLWSAHVLEDAPEKITAVHRAYIEAGADIIETASYQVSRMGYAEVGLDPARADAALLRSVALARQAAAAFPDRRVLIAASLGPYGAALHNGAEYHGNYNCTFTDLIEFHRQRIRVFAEGSRTSAVLKGSDFTPHIQKAVPKGTGFSPYIQTRKSTRALAPEGSFPGIIEAGEPVPDLLAFETLPSLAESEAIGQALAPHPELAAWFSFTCRDERHVAHGELLRQCATAVAAFPQTVAIGVNCTHPTLIPALIAEIRDATDKPIIVYPNSGEPWDAQNRCWTGTSDPSAYGISAAEWLAAGAQIIGGCCRTRPAHIREIAKL
ncbi:MAG TPA: homocysteine S-methyltransferase [Terracidiphilus sp.]|jgi:homocysteine S-methyltransferase